MTEFLLDNIKIRDALKTFLEQSLLDLIELSNVEQTNHLLKTKLVFDDGDSCYTVGTTIVIGTNFPYFSKTSENLCYRQVQAAILHELSHNYLTNFDSYRKFILSSPRKYGVNAQLAKTIANILEDYRIERIMAEVIPFGKKLFFTLRTELINDLYKKIDTLPKSEQEEVNYVLNNLLIIGYSEDYLKSDSERLNNLMEAIKPIVIKAKYSGTTNEVIESSQMILEQLLNSYSGELTVDEHVKVFLGKLNEKGTKSPNESISTVVSNEKSELDEVGKFGGRQDITKNINDAEEIEGIETAYKRMLESIEEEEITAQIINEYLYLNEEIEQYEELRLEEAKKIKTISSELPKTKNLKLIVQEIIDSKYTNLQYERLKEPLQDEINEVVSALMELKEEKENEYEDELKYGQININDLYKFAAYKENSIFQTPIDEEGSLELEVMLLIDESGSNGASVLNGKNNIQMERYKLNRLISIFLHEILKEMKWRHTVWAFHTLNQNEVITPLLTPEESLDAKGLNFANIYAKGSNRDGYHIRIAGEYMARKTEGERKLLIVLSDGQPSAPRYAGEAAIKDVQNAIDEVTQKNVSVIGVFSGDPIENKYFCKSEENPNGMYEKAIFLNNEKLFEFKEAFKDLLIEFYQE